MPGSDATGLLLSKCRIPETKLIEWYVIILPKIQVWVSVLQCIVHPRIPLDIYGREIFGPDNDSMMPIGTNRFRSEVVAIWVMYPIDDLAPLYIVEEHQGSTSRIVNAYIIVVKTE
jgi:hypothetical protein